MAGLARVLPLSLPGAKPRSTLTLEMAAKSFAHVAN